MKRFIIVEKCRCKQWQEGKVVTFSGVVVKTSKGGGGGGAFKI